MSILMVAFNTIFLSFSGQFSSLVSTLSAETLNLRPPVPLINDCQGRSAVVKPSYGDELVPGEGRCKTSCPKDGREPRVQLYVALRGVGEACKKGFVILPEVSRR